MLLSLLPLLLWHRPSDVRSLNNCSVVALAKICDVVHGSNIDFIRFTTDTSDIHSVLVEIRCRFLAKLQSSVFSRVIVLFYD